MYERIRRNQAEFKASESAFGNLFSAMVESGIPGYIAGRIVRHERLHYLADPFRDGNTGFYRGPDFVVGYYEPLRVGEMTPQERKGMVDIVGGEASDADNNFWNYAHNDQLMEEKKADTIAWMIITTVDKMSLDGTIPGFKELVKEETEYIVANYGEMFKGVYEEAVDRAEDFITAFKKTTGLPVDELNADMSSSFGGSPTTGGTGNPASRGGEDVIERNEKINKPDSVGDNNREIYIEGPSGLLISAN